MGVTKEKGIIQRDVSKCNTVSIDQKNSPIIELEGERKQEQHKNSPAAAGSDVTGGPTGVFCPCNPVRLPVAV